MNGRENNVLDENLVPQAVFEIFSSPRLRMELLADKVNNRVFVDGVLDPPA